MLLETYRIHREKWIVEFLFPFLLKWNEWFAAHRMEADGALCWGSDPYEPRFGNLWESNGVNERFGADASRFSKDGVHPLPEGAQYIGEIFRERVIPWIAKNEEARA